MEIVYRAKDGKIFETEARCLEHESQVAVEYFFSKESITTAPGFRYAIAQFKDYVKTVLDNPDSPINFFFQAKAEAEKPTPAFIPVFSEEKEREREFQEAREAIKSGLLDGPIEDIDDLQDFFDDRREDIATYFGFKL